MRLTSESVSVSGLEQSPWVEPDAIYTLTCTVNMIKPEGSIYWKIGDDILEATVESGFSEDGKTYWMRGVGRVYFPNTASSVKMECLITEKNNSDRVLFTKEYKTVQMFV